MSKTTYFGLFCFHDNINGCGKTQLEDKNLKKSLE